MKFDGFETDSGSTEINNAIIEALRELRYEPIQSQDRVRDVMIIQIRNRSTEVAASG